MKKIMFDNHYSLETAVLYGVKTMTRRIIPIQETEGGIVPVTFWNGKWCGAHGKPLKRQPFKVGDVVAIAQSYKHIYDTTAEREGNCKANEWWIKSYDYTGNGLGPAVAPGWSNKMFVRADLMPHQIQITDVRIERLQDITDEDCRKEGIQKVTYDLHDFQGVRYEYGGMKGDPLRHLTPRDAFHELICKLSGKNIWIDNPYVFVYTFKLIK